MAALLTPYETEGLVRELKKAVSIPIQLHTHYTSGLASMCIMKGVEAGVDVVDTAMSPLALGTSHAPTESIVAALKGTEYDTGLDLVLLNEIREYFMGLRKKYIESGLLDQSMLATNTKALIYQVPGGMLSNLLSQLKQAGKADQLEDVLQEVPRVRKDAGYPPLVTPTSQIVGTQAVFNVINGERYKMCTNEFRIWFPVSTAQRLFRWILSSRRRSTEGRRSLPAVRLICWSLSLNRCARSARSGSSRKRMFFPMLQFPKVALDFFKKRRDAKYGIDGKHADAEKEIHPV